MAEIFQIAGSLGVGAFLGLIIFIMYRIDRKASEKRFSNQIDRDQETREANTRIMAELLMWLKNINGKVRRK